MGKNGGQPHDTILTLEEALKRFARKRAENAESRDASVQASAGTRVHFADFAASTKREEQAGIARENAPSNPVSKATTELGAGQSETVSAEDIVAMIDGVPRTFEDLERLAAADKAFREDFPDVADEPEFPEEEDGEPAMAFGAAVRDTRTRDIALGAMGAALLLWVAILITRVPIVNQPRMLAKAVPTPALRASSIRSAQDLIATWVIVPDTEEQMASARSVLVPGELEAAIKDTLKTRAFTDIGVSVSQKGDAYLAGDVYSLDEARRIRRIVNRVSGVRRVHFLHPEVRPADGPAYFGVTTAWAPEVWGAKVQTVIIGSPADKAGVKPGDVISEFDGETVPDAKAFDDLIGQYSPGQRVEFRVWHNGQPVYLLARLTEMTTMASR